MSELGGVHKRFRLRRLAQFGVLEVFDDLRGALIETEVRHVSRTERVSIQKRRESFTAECLDCGPSPHVSPDDHAIAVCLGCGRDRWL